MIEKYAAQSIEETSALARIFVESLFPRTDRAVVVGLYGALGAGKTAFSQAMARTLGVEETVVSPTFVIEKIYPLKNKAFTHLIHIDAYRLEKSSEMLYLGFQEIISDPHNLILIEWPERIADIMPEHVKIKITSVSEHEREIEIER